MSKSEYIQLMQKSIDSALVARCSTVKIPVVDAMKIAAYMRHNPEIVKCAECRYWDKNSGLSARMCYMYNTFTTQFEYCSRGCKNSEEE